MTHRYRPAVWAARRAELAQLKADWAAAGNVTALKAVLVRAFRVLGLLPPA